MISLSGVVSIVIFLIVAALIFGLLWALIVFIGRRIPGEPGQWFIVVGQVVLAVCAVLVLIGLLLSVISDKPLFKP